MSVSSGDSGNAGGEARDASRSLLLCLSRASLSASAQDRASQLLDGPVDWSQLLLWARLHQVIALVTQNLTRYGLENCVPPQVWTQMRQALHGIRFDLLVQFEQVSRVLAALDSAAVDVLVLKGYGL
ncbi:MAG: nucleotidyltransferase family protein, partial [Anaerolineae bacterium]|nr:nucleotidyltransferase family protein [Anaerolineae bacterium]